MKTKNKDTAKRIEFPFSEAELLECINGFAAQLKAGTRKNLRITNVEVPVRLPRAFRRTGPRRA